MINPAKKERVESLYQKYCDAVFRVGMTYMNSEQEAYDIVQEVFLKLINHCGQFRDENHERAWLLRVAINCCKDQLKSRWRKKRISWNEYEDELSSADARDNVSGVALEDRQLILSAVRSLPDIYKEVVILYYYEGYRAEEIARLIHKKPSTVRTRLQKAREQLKQLLKGEDWL